MRTANEILAALGSEQGRRDPMPLFAELHRIGPVCRLVPGTSPYAVVVNGYDAAQEALKDTRFHRLLTADPDPKDPVLRQLGGSMMFRNEPDHLRMRKVFQAVLTPRRLTGFEPVVDCADRPSCWTSWASPARTVRWSTSSTSPTGCRSR